MHVVYSCRKFLFFHPDFAHYYICFPQSYILLYTFLILFAILMFSICDFQFKFPFFKYFLSFR